MGICASYSEARRYEASAALQNQPVIDHQAFKQFVFDNADFNIRTLDGYGTFHSMCGIMCLTPGNAVQLQGDIKRISPQQSTETSLSEAKSIKLQTYHSQSTVNQ